MAEEAKSSKPKVVSKNKELKRPETAKKDTGVKPKPVAKAGKKSAKSIKETEEKQAKETKKVETKAEQTEKKSKKSQKPPKAKIERRGKKYRESAKLIDNSKTYSLKEALDLTCKTSTTKFDSSVELHIRLNVDPKQADQNIREVLVLPEGTGGKTQRVAVFADDDMAKKAKTAGAVIAGDEDLLAKIDKGEIEFDVLIAPPEMMSKLAKYAKILGPKGLMPSPKSGTVTKNVVKAVKESLSGKIEYRVDSYGIVHLAIGKASFGADKLGKNAEAVLSSVKSKKPASIKGAYVNSVFATTSMGPSIKINPDL